MIKITDYTDLSSARKINSLFIKANIDDPEVTEFIANAQRDINAALNITEDLSDDTIAQCNVKTVANYHVSIDCTNYDMELFKSRKEQEAQAKAYKGMYEASLALLREKLEKSLVPRPGRGQVVQPAGFGVKTNMV